MSLSCSGLIAIAYPHVQATGNIRWRVSAQCFNEFLSDPAGDVWSERICPLRQDRSGDTSFAEPADKIHLTNAEP